MVAARGKDERDDDERAKHPEMVPPCRKSHIRFARRELLRGRSPQLATTTVDREPQRERMGRSDEESVVVLVPRGTGSNRLNSRHTEGDDENGEHLQDSHSREETRSRTSWVSPARAISVSTAVQTRDFASR